MGSAKGHAVGSSRVKPTCLLKLEESRAVEIFYRSAQQMRGI
jgi:hypothetical protein